MPPTQSTPSRSAFSSRSSSPSRAKMPSCGNAVTWIVQRSASSSRSAQQPAHHRLVLARDVGVRADEERSLRDRPAHDLARALEDVLLGEARLQLAPDVDALDQRARLVPARLPGGERRVEMEVAVDERRRDEPRLRRRSPARRRRRATRRCGSSGRPRPRGRRAGRRAGARCARRGPRARVYGARKRATSSALRPYGSRAATRSDAAAATGQAAPGDADAHRHDARPAHLRALDARLARGCSRGRAPATAR